MKAACIHAYEATPIVEDALTPGLGADEVLIRIAAAALNPLDIKIQMGLMHDFFPVAFPYTLGTDLAGTVEAVGPGVEDWAAGDRVVARTDPSSGGALAAYAVVPASQLAKAPRSITIEQAAGVPTAAGTAWQALIEVANLQPGQTVLIHGGAGAVGSFAIQIARHLGARVIATASGDGIAIARRLGADKVIDYKAQAFEDSVSDVDVVLDTVGGDTQQRSFGVLRAGGHLVATPSPPDEAFAKAHGVQASFVFHQSDCARLGKLLELVDTGKLKVLVDRTLPLEQLAQALEHQASGRAKGKIIVTM